MILAGGRSRACRFRLAGRAGRPSRGCSGIPGERFDASARCCHEPPAVSRAQLGSAEHSLITATPPPRRRFACATHGSRAATRSSAQTAPYAACQRALQPGGVLIATSGRLARIADTPMPPCCLPPSMASVPTSAIPRRSPCYVCPCLREACTRKQCITSPLCSRCQGRRRIFFGTGPGGMAGVPGRRMESGPGSGLSEEPVRGVSRPRWSQGRSPIALPGPRPRCWRPVGRRCEGGRRWRR